jgi:hypothetical protein
MTKTAIGIIALVAGLAAIFGVWYALQPPPKPMTLKECRAALTGSAEFKKTVESMDETNRTAAYETAAMRCVLDHDSNTASWPEDKKMAVIAHAYCEKQAGGNPLIQQVCEAMAEKEYQKLQKYGTGVLTTPENLK